MISRLCGYFCVLFNLFCFCLGIELRFYFLAVTSTIDLQATWELHYVSYFLRVYKKLFNVKKAYTAEVFT